MFQKTQFGLRCRPWAFSCHRPRMFLRTSIRKKNGKEHRYRSIVEDRRIARLLEYKQAVFDHLVVRWRNLSIVTFDVLLYGLTGRSGGQHEGQCDIAGFPGTHRAAIWQDAPGLDDGPGHSDRGGFGGDARMRSARALSRWNAKGSKAMIACRRKVPTKVGPTVGLTGSRCCRSDSRPGIGWLMH